MKNIFLYLLLLLTINLHGQLIPGVVASSKLTPAYYVKNGGNDNNTGLSDAQAFATITKVNSLTLAPGNRVLFKRGDVWRETLTVPSSGLSGKPITFGAYGIGNSPIISGANIVSEWIQESVSINVGDINAGTPSTNRGNDYVYYFKVTTTSAGEIQSIKENVGSVGSGLAKAAIYTHDAVNDKPLNLVANSSTNEITIATNQWNTYTYSGTKPVVTASTIYWIAVWHDLTVAGTMVSASGYKNYYQSIAYTGSFGSSAGTLGGGTSYSGIGIYMTINSLTSNYYKGNYSVNPKIVIRNSILLKNTATKASLTTGYMWWDDPNDRLYISGNPLGDVVEVSERSSGIIFNSNNYITVDGLYLTGGYGSGAEVGGVQSIVKNCTIKNNFYNINIGSTAGINGLINNNTISYSVGPGISAVKDVTGWIISNNNVSYAGVYNEQHGQNIPNGMYIQLNNPTIECNTVHDNCLDFSNITAPYDYRYSSHGIYCGATSIVRYNNLYHNLYAGLKLNPSNNALVHHNIIYKNDVGIVLYNTTGVNIYHNTIFGNSASGGGKDGFGISITGTSSVANLKNNIIIDNQYSGGVNGQYNIHVSDASSITNSNNNLIFVTSGGNIATYQSVTKSFAQWQALGFDANSINSNPNLVSVVPVYDFHLQVGSPAINAGVDVGLTEDYENNPIVGVPDIGAFEKQ